MADAKPSAGQDPLKFGAVLLLLVGGVILFIHRLPKTGYVEVHKDQPRARPTDNLPAAPAAPAAKPAPAAAPAQRAPSPAAPAPARIVAPASPDMPDLLAPKVDLEEACSAEAGLLCFHVPPERLMRCLIPYQDALRTVCRAALEARGAKFN